MSVYNRGRSFGAILLVAGCCIGAGMLGLPILTGIAGFKPSLLMFFLCWVFMAVTGLLLVEVNLLYPQGVNLITLAEKLLGKGGKYSVWVLFAFLFYSVMVAYFGGLGQLISDFVGIPFWMANLMVLLPFSLFLYLGTRVVDGINRILMAGLIASFFILIAMGITYVNVDYFSHQNWGALVFVLPPMIISFGYHNLIPTLRTYLNGDVKKLKESILIGSFIPLVVYLLWEYVILGLIPVQGVINALEEGEMATGALRLAVGSQWIASVTEYFAFFAVITSLLGVALSFVDFLSDGLSIKKTRKGKALLTGLTLGPPFLFALIYPKIFLNALSYAGAFGAVILFGIIPALMVWVKRYKQKNFTHIQVPGGKLSLVLVMLFATLVILSEILHQVIL